MKLKNTLTTVDLDALKRAFPRDEEERCICAICGKTRRDRDALCRTCWKALSTAAQRDYITLGLVARAYWIIDRIPKARAS